MCLSFSLDVSRFMNFIGFRKIQSGSKKKKKKKTKLLAFWLVLPVVVGMLMILKEGTVFDSCIVNSHHCSEQIPMKYACLLNKCIDTHTQMGLDY